ncbi:MAG: hypothetical protein K0U38_04470, partial [Epsilonproteobacteria bacterium]|nr:hypothetical protein [Campylobacterota bacterium]
QQKESKSFNPLKPFSKPLLHSLSKISMFVLLIIGFVLLGLHLDGEGKEILKMDASNQSVSKGDFTLNSTKYLLAIELSTGTYKSNNHSTLNNFNIKLQQNSKNIFTLNSQNGYIFNEEGVIDKRLSSWESRAKKVIAYIKLKQTGNYQLYITPVNKKVASNVTVNVKEQSARSYYIIYFAILTFIAFLLYYFYYMRYKSQLNQESDNPNHSFSLNGEVIFWIFVVIVIIISGLGE